MDIADLAYPGLPGRSCPRCRAIFERGVLPPGVNIACSVCEFVLQDECGRCTAWPWLQAHRLEIAEHSISELREFAYAVQAADAPPLSIVAHVIGLARRFIHVVTWGADTTMLGMLAVAAKNGVEVRVVVSRPAAFVADVAKYLTEAVNVDIKCVYGDDAPHQKVMVVDGVVGFEGAANFSAPAWQKAANRRDKVKVLTSTDAVRALNNEDFSPVWSDYGSVTTTSRSYCQSAPPPWDDWPPDYPPEEEGEPEEEPAAVLMYVDDPPF